MSVPEDRESVELRVITAPDAVAGTYQVSVHAAAADRRQEVTTTLQVTIQPCAYILPNSWQRAAEGRLASHGGKVYYDQIDVVRGGTPVRFILIPKDQVRRDAPETFYIMRDKVTVGLFRGFADVNAGLLKDTHWKELPANKKNPQYPVTGVIADDAHQFARWLGGYLPLTSQWDQAAGRYRKDRGEGPFRGPSGKKAKPQVAVGRTEPQEVGLAVDDRSLFGVHDMAGNGYELTRDTVLDPDRKVPLATPGDLDFVKLRGRNFKADRPLMFKDLEGIKDYRAHPYSEASEDTSFRVVIEP
jgi:formylglycine-generating enzyme required for sulfatase activity